MSRWLHFAFLYKCEKRRDSRFENGLFAFGEILPPEGSLRAMAERAFLSTKAISLDRLPPFKFSEIH